ncbi:MAG: Smr/MutS family protein [Bdellovibrionales bacterium]|nr:Smr/MutS family protein [Bdellovibrionales bacterium]
MQELKNIDWEETLNHLISFTTSSEAKDKLKKITPLISQEEAEESFATIEEAQNILKTGQRPYMESLDVYHSWFYRLEKNAVLKTIELKDVRLFLLEVETLAVILKPLKGPWISSVRAQLMNPKEALSAIDQLMTPQGDIRTDASETLYKLHQEKRQLVNKVQNTLDHLVKGHEHETALQDKYVTNREGRWVIPIKSGMRHELEGIIHATSSSKQTVFMEPQAIVPLNNRIKELEVDVEKEVARLLKEVSDYLFLSIDDFAISRDTLLEGDIFLAKAQFANVTSAHPVTFSKNQISLNELKHPLMVLKGEVVIPNNLQLNPDERILILSGPNAGGKTVLLKSFGLAAHMARCGLPICAKSESTLPFFEEIFIAVGDTQSVDQSLSTFAGHLKILDQACHAKGSTSLVLIDEICGSTDPDEGAALARGFVHHYAYQGAFGLITSHLGPLKMGWETGSGIVNGSMNYDTESGRPTYEFIRGVPGKSLAFATAKKIGILDSVYNNAKIYLSPAGQKRLQAMEEVEKLKEEISSLKSQLRKEIEGVQKREQELAKQQREFSRDREQLLKKEVGEALEKVKDDIKKDRVKRAFESNESRQKISADFPEVVKYGDSETTSTKFEDIESFMKAFPPGSLVFVTTLNQDGIVQGHPNGKGEIPILSGSMRLFVDWNHLKPPKKTQNPLKKKSASGNHQITYDLKAEDLDLRGLTVNEAIEKLEMNFDKAVANKMEKVKIIHGHGSDALKKAVRSHCSRSVYVSRWQVASTHDGGDGVTIAYLMGD